MKFNFLLFNFLLLFVFNLNAQNTVLVDEAKPLPTNLSKVLGADFSQGDSLETYTQSLFDRFAKKHLSSYYQKAELMNLYDWTNQSFAKRLKVTLTTDRKKLKKLYKSLLPLMKAYFQEMTTAEQEMYKALLEEGEAYLSNFDLERERTDLEKGPYVFFSDRGALKTFIYRRIANDELSQKECEKWIKQLKADFLPLVDKNKTKMDQYFLLGVNYGAYQLASVFPRKDDYLLLKKEGTDYKRLELAEGAKVYTTKGKERYHIQVYRPLDRNGTVLQAFKLKDDRVGIYWFPAEGGYAKIETLEKGRRPDLRRYNYIQHENVILYKNKVFAVNKSNEVEVIELDQKIFSKSIFEFNYKDGTKRILVKNSELEMDRKKVEKVYYPFNRVAILNTDGQLKLLDANKEVVRFDAKVTNMISTTRYCIWTFDNGEQQLWTRNTSSRTMEYKQYTLSSDYQIVKIGESRYGTFTFSTANRKKGVMDKEGKLLIPAEYRDIKVLWNADDITGTYHVYLYQKNTTDSYGIIEEGGKELTKEFFSELNYLSLSSNKEEILYRFRDAKTGKIGVLNYKYELTIKPQYTYLDLWRVSGGNAKLLISTTAKEYKELSLIDLDKGAKVKHLYGMIGLDAKEVLAEKYFGITDVLVNDKKRYLLGKEVAPQAYLYAIADEDFKILSDFHFGFTTKLDTVIDFDPETFEELVDINLNPDIYICKSVYEMSNCQDLLKLTVDGKVGLFDLNGKEILKPEWDKLDNYNFNQATIYVQQGDKVGILNLKNEKMLISADYLSANVLEFGPNFLALVQSPKNKYWGLVLNSKTKPAFLYKEAEAKVVKEKIFFLSKDGDKFAIFKNGKRITDYLFTKEEREIVTFDPETFEEILELVELPLYDGYSSQTKTIRLFTGGQSCLYDFDGKKLKEGTFEEMQMEQMKLKKR